MSAAEARVCKGLVETVYQEGIFNNKKIKDISDLCKTEPDDGLHSIMVHLISVSSRKQSWARFTQRRPVSIRVRSALLQNCRSQFQPTHQMTTPSNNLQKAKSPVYDSKNSRPLGSDTRQQCGISGDQLHCCDLMLEFSQKIHVCEQVAMFDSPSHILKEFGYPKTRQKQNRYYVSDLRESPEQGLLKLKQKKTTLSEQVIFTAESQDICSGLFLFLQRRHVHFKVITVSLRLESMSNPLYIQSQNKASAPPLTCLF